MAAQIYSVTPHSIDTLLTWTRSGEVAIPKIQRPFVWNAAKARDLLDSLYRSYPVGYLNSWRNPTVTLKDGSHSAGKRILIDGQQRVTALSAALHGQEVLDKNYRKVRIRIAFHPIKERFDVYDAAIANDPAWINDVTEIFHPDADLFDLREEYVARNVDADGKAIGKVLQGVLKIVNNHVGVIELAKELDIETVAEIFMRVNSAGVRLSQADCVMSKIAVNEAYGGRKLRKAIDYFCHLVEAPESMSMIESADREFVASEFWPRLKWLKNVKDRLYSPKYTDMLHVAFVAKFGRGRLQELVALLSGRNFETRGYEEAISEDSFDRLKEGVNAFINQNHFDRLTMILRSAGFLTPYMIRSQSAANFAYVLYLYGREKKVSPHVLERLVRRWFAMSIVTRRYSGSSETTFGRDIQQIASLGIVEYVDAEIANVLSDDFWNGRLPQLMNVSIRTSPFFIAFMAAQARLGDKGFLSTDIAVSDLLLNRGDVHHVFPRRHLTRRGLPQRKYNQIANFVYSQSEINIAIGDKSPETYFSHLAEQVAGGRIRYGGIEDRTQLAENFRQNCLPISMLDGEIPEYEDFLAERRILMAIRIKEWFDLLSGHADCS